MVQQFNKITRLLLLYTQAQIYIICHKRKQMTTNQYLTFRNNLHIVSEV